MRDEKNRQVLEKMIRHIDHTLEYCAEQSFDGFMANRMLQEACIFNVLQLGELSKVGLDETFTAAHPEIAWHEMYGMRNRMVHDYEGVRMKVVWETITKDFPELRGLLKDILNNME